METANVKIKKTILTISMISSGLVYSGTMGSVFNEPLSPRWDFGAKALYLQPSLSADRYTHERTITLTSGASAVWGSNPKYGWDFFLEGSYHVNDRRDFNLNWYHYRNSANLNRIDIDDTPYALRYHLQWDAVNLESGYLFNFDTNNSLRLHFGAQYAHLNNNEQLDSGAGTIDGIHILPPVDTRGSTSYNGFGPRAGVEYNYNWHKLSLYSNVAGALLAGSTKFNKFYIYSVGTASATNASTMTIVPEAEATLGAKYHYPLAKGDLALDMGWMWANYWEALNTLDISGLGITSATNIAFQGPFIGFHWLG